MKSQLHDYVLLLSALRVWYFTVKTKPVTQIGKSTKRADGKIRTSSRSSVTRLRRVHTTKVCQHKYITAQKQTHPTDWSFPTSMTSEEAQLLWEQTACTAWFICPRLLCSSDSSSCHQPALCSHLQTCNEPSSDVVLICQTSKHLVTSSNKPQQPTVGEEH